MCACCSKDRYTSPYLASLIGRWTYLGSFQAQRFAAKKQHTLIFPTLVCQIFIEKSFQSQFRMMFEQEKQEDEVDDILFDSNFDRERTLTGKWAIATLGIVFICITLAFCTPYWIEGDPRFYGTKAEKAGLWVHCLRSLPDHNDYMHQRYFAGCRWLFNPFTEGYDGIRDLLAPRKS